MPRDNYIITSDDECHATFYLSGRLRNYGFKFRDSVSSTQAESDYRGAANEKTKATRAAALNVWCERYLSKADWRRLKSAVRKRRERWRRCEETKTVNLSAKAHKVLKQISKRDSVTADGHPKHLRQPCASLGTNRMTDLTPSQIQPFGTPCMRIR